LWVEFSLHRLPTHFASWISAPDKVGPSKSTLSEGSAGHLEI
jgi:hypothetical protein